MLGLGTGIVKGGIKGIENFGIVTDNLVLNHSNYHSGQVHQVSTGAADINSDGDANEYIDVGAITIGAGDVSVSAWVYVTSFVDYGGIFSNRQIATTNPGIDIRTRSSGTKIEIIIDNGANSEISASGALNTHQWYHVCAVWDRSDKQFLYIDGVLVDSDTISVNEVGSLSHSNVCMIGRRNFTGTTFDFQGYICNVGYWNRTLTQAEIKSIWYKNYANLTAAEKTNLVSWYNLSENANDSHGSNNGTLS